MERGGFVVRVSPQPFLFFYLRNPAVDVLEFCQPTNSLGQHMMHGRLGIRSHISLPQFTEDPELPARPKPHRTAYAIQERGTAAPAGC